MYHVYIAMQSKLTVCNKISDITDRLLLGILTRDPDSPRLELSPTRNPVSENKYIIS